jgi:holo-[acyl-carrier protein] synthase
LVETERVARAIYRQGRRFEERVFSAGELADCTDRADRAQALAARFAAKEACIKALGLAAGDGTTFRDVETLRQNGDGPVIWLAGPAEARARRLGVRHIHVTLTHQPSAAAAVVILEG